jgi:endonuclease/exonuclease/phosphatase family metal-dependent hydrolase
MPLTLATFNTKDLLDPRDDAARAHLEKKLDHVAGVLGRLDADVLALQEVGTEAVLEQLCGRLEKRGGYGAPIVGTADNRGIRNAILTRLPVLASKVHAPARLDFPVFHAGDPPPFGDRVPMRRGVVHAKLDAGALGPLDVLVAHFKSNLRLLQRDANGVLPAWSDALSARELAEAELRSLVWRSSEALFVRGLVDELLRTSPDARVAVMGDLNDRPGSLVLRVLMGHGPGALHACADVVDSSKRYSIIFRGKRELFDHVLVSARLRERARSARILNDELRDHALDPAPTVDSDHAPLVALFE